MKARTAAVLLFLRVAIVMVAGSAPLVVPALAGAQVSRSACLVRLSRQEGARLV
jgi:hypothetical protein